MNKILILSAVIALVSCGSQESEGDDVNADSLAITQDSVDVDTENSLDAVNPEELYASDWNAFASAVVNNDLTSMKKYIDADHIDAEQLLGMLREDWVLTTLEVTTYEELGDNADMFDYEVKEFGAYISDEVDGEVYESGLYLYFQKKEEGLRLVEYLAAG